MIIKHLITVYGKDFGSEGSMSFKYCTEIFLDASHGGSLNFTYQGPNTGLVAHAVFKLSEITGWTSEQFELEE